MKIERQEEKYCTKCRRLLPLTEFLLYRHRNGAVYIRSECKGCMREYRQQRREKDRGYSKEWRKAHPGYNKEYRRRSREKEKQNIIK